MRRLPQHEADCGLRQRDRSETVPLPPDSGPPRPPAQFPFGTHLAFHQPGMETLAAPAQGAAQCQVERAKLRSRGECAVTPRRAVRFESLRQLRKQVPPVVKTMILARVNAMNAHRTQPTAAVNSRNGLVHTTLVTATVVVV